jgi:GMP synthase (glutamine-hydrolysing)
MKNIQKENIVIIDFGSQYTQLIARRIREIGTFCEILPYDCDPELIRQLSPGAIVLSGGPESVHVDEKSPKIPEIVFELKCPILGICYGMQALVHHFGGVVTASDKREFGHAQINIVENNNLLPIEQLGESIDVWMSHGDKVTKLPKNFLTIAKSKNAPIAAIKSKQNHIYGLQFHPEVTHTSKGNEILEYFIKNIAKLETNWNADNIIEQAVEQIKNQVGSSKVVLGLSGGVDSSVVAALCNKAIGQQLTCVFVDNGLLRLKEAEQVLQTFSDHMGLNIIHVDARDLFLEALKGESCPEKKRKIIGKTFIDVFDTEAKKIPGVKFLAQGTIYPDIIESAGAKSGKAHVIKSHHNVGGLPENMNLKLCEPLKMLFKDEVRKIGLELGLHESLIFRHPFPGPGLGVRVLGEVKPEYLLMLQKADNIFIESLHEWNYYQRVSQAFAVFLPVKTVGVMGDQRKYDFVIALRAVETIDFMTARWAPLPYDLLAHVSNRIINEVDGIARVTYDISGKPPATIEWE